ncbi:MAG: hypothetical protein IKI15_11735 [Lachnospiraceae bacterium]|nr:hypothetical protein [Lachnospiraceae bacterium]MBR4813108.1 hypothetical protein [Lachnospiraceae bacterium]MBR7021703.1 hypothetical protein [Lachnospiraceae bacterium]
MLSSILEIVSCVFTVVALLFSLYMWLIDRNDEDNMEFYKKKKKYLETLYKDREIIEVIDETANEKKELSEKMQDTWDTSVAIDEINNTLRIITAFRFWGRSRWYDRFPELQKLFSDSIVLSSQLKRCCEEKTESLVGIRFHEFYGNQLPKLRKDYLEKLDSAIVFLEHVE